MPHLIVEYSANIEDQIALDALLDKLHTCALGTGVFPLGGLRVRAHRADAYRIADLSPDNGFVTGQVLYVCGGTTLGVAPI